MHKSQWNNFCELFSGTSHQSINFYKYSSAFVDMGTPGMEFPFDLRSNLTPLRMTRAENIQFCCNFGMTTRAQSFCQ